MATGFVYFIRAENGLIKIGFSAESPDRRLSELRQGNAVRLERVALLLGGVPLEKLLHYRFDGCRSHCEWFHPADELTTFIAAHAWPWAGPLHTNPRRHGIPDRFKADGLFKADPWFKAEAVRVARAREESGRAWWTPEGKALERAATLMGAFPKLSAAMARAMVPPPEPGEAGDEPDGVLVVYRDGPLAGLELEFYRRFLADICRAGVQTLGPGDGPTYYSYRPRGECGRDAESVDVWFTGRVTDYRGKPLTV